MVRIGEQFFLCINNSDKVVVLNRSSLVVADVINIPKPRYVLPVSEAKAYISSEYSNNVYVIDPQSHTVTDTIKLPYRNTEGMCLDGNYAFICTWDTACNAVFKVDVANNKLVKTITIPGYAPQEVLVDKEGMLWVLSGDQPQGRACVLTRLEPSSGAVLATYNFASNVNAIKPVFNSTKDTLYFIEADYFGGTVNNGVYRMAIGEAVPQLFVAAKQYQYFWGLGVDPLTGYVYLGDPKGFVQKGTVYVYRQNGVLLKNFNVGLGPGHFYFDQ
jgi:YVTN family beta-propeller protein